MIFFQNSFFISLIILIISNNALAVKYHLIYKNRKLKADHTIYNSSNFINLLNAEENLTILHTAAYSNHFKVIKSLTKKACSQDFLNKATSKYKNTALHIASYYGHSYIVNRLINAQANINLLNTANYSPLDLALTKKQYKTAEIILNNGGITNKLNNNELKKLNLEEIIEQNYLQIADFIISKLQLNNERLKTTNYEIKKAIVEGNTHKAKKAILESPTLSKNAKNFLCNDSCKLIHLMAYFDITKNLSQPKAIHNIEAHHNLDQVTPLFIACKKGNVNFVQAILNLGANPNNPIINNWTPLQIAAKRGYFDIAKLLIDAKANIETTQKDGWNALDFALREKHIYIIKLLSEIAHN